MHPLQPLAPYALLESTALELVLPPLPNVSIVLQACTPLHQAQQQSPLAQDVLLELTVLRLVSLPLLYAHYAALGRILLPWVHPLDQLAPRAALGPIPLAQECPPHQLAKPALTVWLGRKSAQVAPLQRIGCVFRVLVGLTTLLH